jgi:hypothetical protein
VNARRLIPLGLAVAGLVAIAGIASNGRPLGGARRGSGPSATFFDYLATTLLLVAVVLVALTVWAIVELRDTGGLPPRSRWHLLGTLLAFALAIAAVVLLVHTGFINRIHRIEGRHLGQQPTQEGHAPQLPRRRATRNARLRWDEIAVFAALVLGAAAIAVATRRTRRKPRLWRFARTALVEQAIDDSLDDLRADPNLRRAIIAAYARMEHALGRSGLGRRPSEAPFEYVGRALLALETSGESAERLAALFERAKFSQHEPGPEMRDEAIAALLAVRDDLAREPVTA